MPVSITIGSFVLGAFLLIMAIAGGNFKLFGAEFAGKVESPYLRVFAGLLSVAFLGIALSDTFKPEGLKPASSSPMATLLPNRPTASPLDSPVSPRPSPNTVPTQPQSDADTPSPSTPIGYLHSSNNRDGVTVAVVNIEPQGEDRVRWSFVIRNQSNEDVSVWFNDQKTYLVDEFGNQYEVLRMQTSLHTNVPAGVRKGLWIDFPPPRDGAKSFTVVLESVHTFDGAYFDPLEVTFP